MIVRIAVAAWPEKFAYGRWIVVTGQNVPTPVCPALGSNGAMPRLLSTLETVINSCRKTFGATGAGWADGRVPYGPFGGVSSGPTGWSSRPAILDILTSPAIAADHQKTFTRLGTVELRLTMFVHNGFDSEGDRMTENVELPVWRTPDFVEYDTPMEITGYVARMD